MFRKLPSNLVNALSKRSFVSIHHPRQGSLFETNSKSHHREEENRRNKSFEGNATRQYPIKFIVSSSFLSWFSKKDDEDSPENQLIKTIKMSILNIQREDYRKAEQMLHIALKMAQDLQSKDGITYIYDIMANLAMEVDGFVEDHIKMLHISSKIAHIAQLQGHLDKAIQGFEWTIAKLEENMKKAGEDKEIMELWGITKNWYAQLLMELKRFTEARHCFKQAYDAYTQIHGTLTEEGLTILNNLSVACSNLEDYASAEKYLKEAISLASKMPDLTEEGVYRTNLGLLYLQQGLLNQAKEFCSFAWKYGKQHKHEETVIQANYCLEQIKAMQK